ncbi:hypothetical protein [Desulfolucanica intricata]|uniref:hypothetical protein n=1 Tax=Desulfolucanica intricata TaxID=1285191 RepID=UPI000832FC1D|nr:hypothetical protein [Desulfolucanica intricata]
MKQKNKTILLKFQKIGHFWLDSGLVGMKKILDDMKKEVLVREDYNGIILEGSKEDVQKTLEGAYDNLVNSFYNISTRKQIEDTRAYNFYYDSKKDCFYSFPKKKSCGIAEIIYNKAPRPTGISIKWAHKSNKKVEFKYNGKSIKRTLVQLPETHSYLQERMDEFVNENELDITTAGLLVDGPNAVKPKVTIKAGSESKKIKGHCFFCGEPSDTLEEASQTTFPLITGTSGVLSFNSMAQKPEKVCWKCSFLGKFVPVNGFYYTSREDIFAFFPYSSSLEKMLEVFEPLHEAEYKDPNYYRNFNNTIEGYYYHIFEVTFVFLYTLYKKVLLHQNTKEEPAVLDWERLYNLTVNKAPLEFYTMHARKEGNTFSIKTLWPFRETFDFYRLLDKIEKSSVNIKEVMRLLVDFQQKNENTTLIRNRICERILKKKSILDLIEIFVYRTGKNYILPVVDFLIVYEAEVRKDDSMTKEEQEAAVALGRRIGTAVAKSDSGKKGDLYSLRKARKKVDFLEQINRLQFKLCRDKKGNEFKFIVPADIYEGKLTDENFQEFKQFCMIAALNSFNAASSDTKK